MVPVYKRTRLCEDFDFTQPDRFPIGTPKRFPITLFGRSKTQDPQEDPSLSRFRRVGWSLSLCTSIPSTVGGP